MIAPLTRAIAMIALAFALFEWKGLSPGLRSLLVLVVWTVLVTSLSAVKNLRYAVNSDGLVRALAAWFLVERFLPVCGRRWAAVLLGANALYELWIFHRVFITGGVYDPVTAELARALSMTP